MSRIEKAHAVWFTKPRHAELLPEDIQMQPEAESVVVRSLYSLISSGTEMNVYRGQIKTNDELLSLSTARGTFPFPVKYAYQIVGEVIAAGAHSGCTVGEVVFVQHPHQDLFAVHKDLVYRVPSGLDPRKAVFANLMCVAITGLLDAPVRFGDVAVVSGAGVVGSLTAAIARRTAQTLVLVEPSDRGRIAQAVCQLDHVVAPEDAVERVRAITEDRLADLWFECSGAPRALQMALEGTGMEGEIVVLSYYGNRTVPLDLAPEFLFRRQRIRSSYVGYLGSGLQPRWDRRRRMQVAFSALQTIAVERLVSHIRPFHEASACYRLIDEGSPDSTLAVLLDYRA